MHHPLFRLFACLNSLKSCSYVVNRVGFLLISIASLIRSLAFLLAKSNCDCFEDRLFFVHYFIRMAICVCEHVCCQWACIHNWNQLKCLFEALHQPVDSLLPIAQWRTLIVVWTQNLLGDSSREIWHDTIDISTVSLCCSQMSLIFFSNEAIYTAVYTNNTDSVSHMRPEKRGQQSDENSSNATHNERIWDSQSIQSL